LKRSVDTLHGYSARMGAGKSQFTEEELQDYQVRLLSAKLPFVFSLFIL